MENETSENIPAASRGKAPLIIGVLIAIALIAGWIILKKDTPPGNDTTAGTTASPVAASPAVWPKDWPTDVPQYSNSTVVFSGSNNSAGGKLAVGVLLTTTDTPETVVAFYRDKMVADGWKIRTNSFGSNAISLALEKGPRETTLVAGTTNGQTGITLSVGYKQ